VTGGVPGFFGDEQTGKRVRNLGLWFEWNFDDPLIAGLFSFHRLELVDVVTVRRKKRKRTDFRGVGDGKFQPFTLESDFHGDRWDLGGHFAADFVEKSLQVDIGFGLGGDGEIEVGLARQAGFLANEPFDICFDWKGGWNIFVIRNLESGKEECFLFVAVTDKRRDENLFRERKLEFAGGPSGGKFPSHGRGETGVARVFPIDMPTGHRTKTKPKSDRFSGFHGFRFSQQVHRDLGCLGDRSSPEGSLEKRETSEDTEEGGSWAGHKDRIS
jgi:hypothetical protein